MLDFNVPANNRVKKDSEKINELLGSCQRAEKTAELEGDGDTNCSWSIWDITQRLRKEIGRKEDQRMDGNHTDLSILKISSNIQKCAGNIRRLTVTYFCDRSPAGAEAKNSQRVKQ